MQELLLATGGSGGKYYPESGPGPKTIELGDIDAGFFGAVSKELLLTDKVFAAMIKGTDYVDLEEEDKVWFKFAYMGKFLYMPKRPIAIDLTHPALYESGMTHPAFGGGDYPYSGNKIAQDAKIAVKEDGKKYTLSVRLPRTYSDSNHYVTEANLPLVNTENEKRGEIYNTLIKLYGGASDGVNFSKTTYQDTLPNGILNNTKANVLCAEVHLAKNNLVNRRYTAAAGGGDFLATGIYSKKNGSNDIMYRPMLEYLPNTSPLQTVKKMEGMAAIPLAVNPIVELSTSELVMPLMLKCEQPLGIAFVTPDESETPLPQIAHALSRDQGNHIPFVYVTVSS